MQTPRPNQSPVSSASTPQPLAPEMLKLIGGGTAAPTSSPTPQAPKNKW